MAGVAVNTPKIEQLTDSFAKWRTWKVHMQALLMERGLWTLVGQGTEIRPDVLVRGPGVNQAAVDARNTAIQGFDKKIAKATGLMVPTISGELFCFFTPGFLEDPRQLWIDLGNHFEAQSESHRLSLRTKLLHFQLREGEDPEEWVKERMRLYQQLTLSGNMVTDREQVLETLSLLPGSWQQFKNFLIFGDNGQLTMVSLVQKMTDWKLINKPQQKANSNGGKNSEHLYQVNTPKDSHTNAQSPSTASKPKKTFDKSRVKCYNCNEYGHFAKECPKPARKKVGASVAVGNVDDVRGRNVGGSADKDSREKTNMKRGNHNLDEKAFVTKKKKPQLVGTVPRTATADSQDGSSQLESSSFKSEQKSEVASEEVEEVLACTEKWKPTPILLDSGATNHMSPERDAFRDFVHFRKTKKILLADGYELQAHGQGDLVMTNGYLKSCFYVPDLIQTLWSVPKSTKNGYSILFDGRGVEVTDSSGEISATGKLRGNAYIMNCSLVDQSGKYTEEPGNGNESQPNCDYCKIQSCFIAADFETWHKRMGHLNVQSLRSLCSGKVVNDFSVKGPRELNFCEACAKGKATAELSVGKKQFCWKSELMKMVEDSDTRSGSDRKRPPRRSRSRSRSPRRSGAKRSREGGNDRMVYISNIPYDVHWMEVKDLVREKAGEVTYVEMLETPDGKSKGCAVVEFKDKNSAKKCVDDMHRMQLKDRYIVVKEIQDPVAFFRKVKEDIGVDFMANRSGPTVMESPGHGHSGMAYETYGLSPSFLRQLGIDGPLCCRVFVANLPYNVQSGKIHEVFSMAGKVVMVDLQLDKDGKSKGFAVVEYTHPIEAVQAVSMLNNQRLFDRSMSVKMDKYEKPQDPRRPGELPAGLKAVGMGLGTNGAPLTNVDQLISAVVPAVQPAPQPLLSQLTGSNPGPTSLLSRSFGAGAHGAGGYGNLGSVGGGSQSQSMGSYGGFGGGGGGGSAFDGTDRYSGAPRSLMASEPYGTDRMRNEFDGPRREYDVAGRLSPLAARRSSRAVIIQNLPVDYTWQMVRDRLRGFGDIEFADIVQPGVAKVRFKTGMDTERAVSGLNGMSVEGRPITVDFGYSD